MSWAIPSRGHSMWVLVKKPENSMTSIEVPKICRDPQGRKRLNWRRSSPRNAIPRFLLRNAMETRTHETGLRSKGRWERRDRGRRRREEEIQTYLEEERPIRGETDQIGDAQSLTQRAERKTTMTALDFDFLFFFLSRWMKRRSNSAARY